MAKGINTIINDVKTNLIGVINEAQLPISVVCLIVNDLARQLIEQERQALQREAQEDAESRVPKQEVIKNEEVNENGNFKDEIR